MSGHITSLAVLREFRRLGLAEKLMTQARTIICILVISSRARNATDLWCGFRFSPCKEGQQRGPTSISGNFRFSVYYSCPKCHILEPLV